MLTLLCVALAITNYDGLSSIPAAVVVVVFAQTHQMNATTTSSSTASESATYIQNKSTFSAIGSIDSLVITVHEPGFNITNAFKVILTGEWNLSVNKGKITNFVVNFLASPMDGSKGHIHQITNFRPDNNGKAIELTSDNSLSVNGTADIKVNGFLIWNDAHISILISKGNTFSIDPDDKETGNHFGKQPVYGIVTRMIY
jgi:hypothetical protein